MKYRKKPVVIDAILHNGDESRVQLFVDKPGILKPGTEPGCIDILSPFGISTALEGDYIVKDENGNFKAYSADLFKANYDKVDTTEKMYTYFVSFTFNSEEGQAFANTVLKLKFEIESLEDVAFLNNVLKRYIKMDDVVMVILNFQLMKTEEVHDEREN